MPQKRSTIVHGTNQGIEKFLKRFGVLQLFKPFLLTGYFFKKGGSCGEMYSDTV